VFFRKGGSEQYYQPQRILLNLGAQPLMLGKTLVEGLKLTDANLEPCMYQILPWSMLR